MEDTVAVVDTSSNQSTGDRLRGITVDIFANVSKSTYDFYHLLNTYFASASQTLRWHIRFYLFLVKNNLRNYAQKQLDIACVLMRSATVLSTQEEAEISKTDAFNILSEILAYSHANPKTKDCFEYSVPNEPCSKWYFAKCKILLHSLAESSSLEFVLRMQLCTTFLKIAMKIEDEFKYSIRDEMNIYLAIIYFVRKRYARGSTQMILEIEGLENSKWNKNQNLNDSVLKFFKEVTKVLGDNEGTDSTLSCALHFASNFFLHMLHDPLLTQLLLHVHGHHDLLSLNSCYDGTGIKLRYLYYYFYYNVPPSIKHWYCGGSSFKAVCDPLVVSKDNSTKTESKGGGKSIDLSYSSEDEFAIEKFTKFHEFENESKHHFRRYTIMSHYKALYLYKHKQYSSTLEVCNRIILREAWDMVPPKYDSEAEVNFFYPISISLTFQILFDDDLISFNRSSAHM